MNNNSITYICGLPGYGSSGGLGDKGEQGSSFHIINNNDNTLSEIILSDESFKVNDLFYNNDNLYIINEKDHNNSILSYNKICSNPLNKIIKNINNSINLGYNVLLSDNIITKNQLNDNNIDSLLTIKQYLNSNNFISLNKNDIKYDNSINKFLLFNEIESLKCTDNLFVKYDSSLIDNEILSEKYGISELNKLSKSYKHIKDASYIFTYKINNAKYRLTSLSYNDNEYIEREIIGFDDDNNEFSINDTSIFKLYYLSNISKSDNEKYNGYIISKLFNINSTISLLKNVKILNNDETVNNAFKVILNKNTNEIKISKQSNTNQLSKIYLEFDKNSDITINNDPYSLYESSDYINKIVILKIPNYDINNNIFNIVIGNINYSILLSDYIEREENIKLNFKLEDDKNGYLGCNSFYHGVPTNGILQVYSLNFYEFDDSNIYKFNFNIKSSVKLDDVNAHNDYRTNIYYKIIKTHKKSEFLDNDTFVYLNDIEDANFIQADLNISTDAINFTFEDDANNFDLYSNDNTSSYKLVIYYEFNEPFYGILNTDISGTLNDNNFNSLNKKTLMIPWEIIGFAPINLSSSTDYNLSINTIFKRDSGLQPKNLSSLFINPVVDNEFIYKYTFNRYNYQGKNEIIDESVNNLDTFINIYSNDSFLTIAYNRPNNNEEISYYNEYRTFRQGLNCNFAQCEIGYPIWVKTQFGDTIKPNINEYHSKIINPSGTIYSPKSAEDYMVDLNEYHNIINRTDGGKLKYDKYKNYLVGNTFIGFIEWSLQKNITKSINGNIVEEYTKKYPFTNVNGCLTEYDKTLYGLYWDINPRIIESTKSEIGYDTAINMLKIPKIYTPNGNQLFYVNDFDTNAVYMFQNNKYIRPYSITENDNYQYDIL